MIAAYIRVSTDEQTTANQRPDLERLAAARGWNVDRWYVDEGVSGTKQRRPGLDKMLKELRAGDVVLVWRLDRLGRSMLHMLNLVRELDERGVALASVGESWLDTAGPMRRLLTAIFAWFAEYERETIVERTKAGLQRARSEGVTLGRRKVSSAALDAAVAGYGPGVSVRSLARAAKVSEATLRRRLRQKGLLPEAPTEPVEATPAA